MTRAKIKLIVTALSLALALAGVGPASAAGQLLVLNKSEDTLAFVDPVKLELLGIVPTGRAPHELAVDAASATAYVANYGTQAEPGHTISVVDLAARRLAGLIELGEHLRPHGLTIAPDGSLWITCEGSREVVVVDPKARKVLRSFKTGQQVTHMVVLTPDGKRAYTANIGSDTVTSIDAVTGDIIQIPVGKGPEAIDVTPDGKEVWVAHREDGGITIIEASTGKVIQRLENVGAMPIRLKFTPDGKRVLISCARGGEVVLYDTARRSELARIKTGEMPIGLLVLPGGSRAFVANTQADKVSLLDLDKAEVIGAVSPGREPDGLAWMNGGDR